MHNSYIYFPESLVDYVKYTVVSERNLVGLVVIFVSELMTLSILYCHYQSVLQTHISKKTVLETPCTIVHSV